MKTHWKTVRSLAFCLVSSVLCDLAFSGGHKDAQASLMPAEQALSVAAPSQPTIIPDKDALETLGALQQAGALKDMAGVNLAVH